MGDLAGVPAAEQGFVNAARALAPKIQARAAEFELDRRLPQDLARDMAMAGLHKIAAPKYAGGSECHPLTQISVIEAIAEADGSAGWNLMIGVEVQGFAAAAFPPELAQRYFSAPGTIVAGALNPMGRAEPVSGGLRLSGRWPMASGCQNADYFWGQALVMDGAKPARRENGAPVLRELLIPMAEMEVLGNWHANGLRGSGSHDVQATNITVPDERITRVTEQLPFAGSTLFRFPTFSRLAYNKAAVAAGIARAAINHFKTLATEKKPLSSKDLLCERGDAQRAIADAETQLRSGRAFMFEAVSHMWDLIAAGEPAGAEPRALVLLSCINAVQGACRAVDGLYAAAGASVVYADSALGRCHRDVHIVPQHITVSQQWTEAAGRMLLGLQSDAAIL